MNMGCVESKADINDTHPNIFHVININDVGKTVARGKLEVTDTELILHQRGKNPVKWPLRSLRKYGWDISTQVFSIECGRRSPTGAGYYAFKCKKAAQLFELVQLHIIGGVPETALVTPDYPLPSNQPEFSVHSPGASSIMEPQMPDSGISRSRSWRPSSVSSTEGESTPTALSPPGSLNEVPSLEHNNNKRNSANATTDNNGISPTSYVNWCLTDSLERARHVYMNVDAKEFGTNFSPNTFVEPRDYQRHLSEEAHCYANIDTRDVENIHLLQRQSTEGIPLYLSNSVPCTPTVYYESDFSAVREVNYAELDLDAAKHDNSNSNSQSSAVTVIEKAMAATQSITTKPESPKLQKKSYATIDFPKTIALSQSIKPKCPQLQEEGIRKTRHNFSINSLSD